MELTDKGPSFSGKKTNISLELSKGYNSYLRYLCSEE